MKPTRCVWAILSVGTILPYFGPLACVIVFADLIQGSESAEETVANILQSFVLTNKIGFSAIVDDPGWGIIWWLAPVPAWLFAIWIYRRRFATSERFQRRQVAAVGCFIGLCVAPIPTAVLAWNLTNLWEDLAAIFVLMAWWYPTSIASMAAGWFAGLSYSPAIGQ